MDAVYTEGWFLFILILDRCYTFSNSFEKEGKKFGAGGGGTAGLNSKESISRKDE